MRKILFTIFLILLIPRFSFAVLPDCQQATVAAALASANPGDTVECPADTRTWTSAITIPTGVTLKGAGIGNTIITGTYVNMGNNSVLTGFEFTDPFYAKVRYVNGWRIHHNKFQRVGAQKVWLDIGSSCVTQKRHVDGLADNNTILNARIGIFGCNDDAYSDELWFTGWREYNDPAEKVYIEDNTITQSEITGVIDSNYSGRYVVRNNTITEGYFEAHGARNARGIQSWEIYRNTINNVSICPHAGNIRGGSGVVFQNTLTGGALYLEWAFSTERCATSYSYSGLCNGDSLWDTEPHPKTSLDYLCRDAFAGKDSQLGSGQATAPPYSQTSLPAYMWSNTENGATWNARISSACATKILENRDFYMDNSSDPNYGLGGVQIGTSLPGTCTPYQGYWKINEGSWNTATGGTWGGVQGVLYKCTATNTWTAYYTPYTYPHPLRGEGTGPPPPIMIAGYPFSPLDCTSNPRDVYMSINTDQAATCKWSLVNQAYANMPNTFSSTGGTYHSTTLTSLSCLNSYVRYVRCASGGTPTTESYPIAFLIKSPNVLTLGTRPSIGAYQ